MHLKEININAEDFPEGEEMEFDFVESSKSVIRHEYFIVNKKKGIVCINIVFSIHEEYKLKMKLNPNLIYNTVLKKLTKAGFKTEGKLVGEDDRMLGHLYIKITSGSILEHYLRGVKMLEAACKEAVEEVRRRKDL